MDGIEDGHHHRKVHSHDHLGIDEGMVKKIMAYPYKEVEMKFEYRDTTERESFLEYTEVEQSSGNIFIATKFMDKFGDEGISRYKMTEINPKENSIAEYVTAYSQLGDSLMYFNKNTEYEPMEKQSFFIGKKEYNVYKIVIRDHHSGGCETSIYSPEFGFVFGRGSFSSADIVKISEDKSLTALVRILRQNESFISCKGM